MKSRLATLFIAAAALTAGLLIPAMSTQASGATPAARAPSLSLLYDGTDPITTGCSNTAVNVVSMPANGGGTLQLRWSTACKTNWGRYVPNAGNTDQAAVWVYRQADNLWCGDKTGGGCPNGPFFRMPQTIYSNQLYGCNYQTLAQVELLDNLGVKHYTTTPLEGGC